MTLCTRLAVSRLPWFDHQLAQAVEDSLDLVDGAAAGDRIEPGELERIALRVVGDFQAQDRVVNSAAVSQRRRVGHRPAENLRFTYSGLRQALPWHLLNR